MKCIHYTNEELKEFQSLVRGYIWTTRRPLSFKDTVRPRKEGGIAEMDLFSVRDTLAIYWVRELRRKRIWASLVTQILTHGMSEDTARKITMPWGQVWSSGGARTTPAVGHFWPYWEQTQLHRTVDPCNAEDVFGIHFWFHPDLSSQYRANWYAAAWRSYGMGKKVSAQLER